MISSPPSWNTWFYWIGSIIPALQLGQVNPQVNWMGHFFSMSDESTELNNNLQMAQFVKVKSADNEAIIRWYFAATR